MFNCKKFLFFCLISLLSSKLALATPTSCQSTDCEALGYTKSASACTNGVLLRCPFDTNKVICQSFLATPVFKFVQGILASSTPTNVDNITYSTSLNDLCNGSWVGSCSNNFCYKIYGQHGLECDVPAFRSFSTVGDAVVWVEENLLEEPEEEEPCAGWVTVDSELEKCTSYCAEDTSKCMIKQNLTCAEAASRAGGTLLLSPKSILADAIYYISKDLSFTSTTRISNVTFYEASSLRACARDPSVTQSPKLKFSSLSKLTSTTFGVATEIDYINVSWAESFSVVATRDLKIKQVRKTANMNMNYPSTIILGTPIADPRPFDVVVGLYCEDSGGGSTMSPMYCTTNIRAENSGVGKRVKWCDGSSGYAKNQVNCQNVSCTEAFDTYSCQY